MLFRHRANNYPESLNETELRQWKSYSFQHITDPQAGGSIAMEEYQQTLEQLFMAHEDQSDLLSQLMDWADAVCIHLS